MRESRTLRLRKERLSELTVEELGGVAGGTHLGCVGLTATCTHGGACGTTQSILPARSCIAPCPTDVEICTTR